MDSVCSDIESLKSSSTDVLVVSSGAVALGRSVLQLPAGNLDLDERQAAAAVGQISLAHAWSERLSLHNIVAGQILVTLSDTEERYRYLNARTTLFRLLKFNSVPIINENDTVSTTEIRYGDNDRLAARIATMISADLLIILSDVDGLYTAPPNINPKARFIARIDEITPEVEAMAREAASEMSCGGMKTKIDAGKIATSSGCAMIIANGTVKYPLKNIQETSHFSWFKPSSKPFTARKRWISGKIYPEGKLYIDSGAVVALHSGKSLLSAGVQKVEGSFSRGSIVIIMDPSGYEIARGLVGYDSHEAKKIAGCKSIEIKNIIGDARQVPMIHRDDMVLFSGENIKKDTSHA
ncbi:Glutamate 5-kinase [Liberibacter crescens BT-1]|uniref:Glutamate 5-kinase n=2 Tax=Liberibacter crescens TaxID=1273132 RepID=L0EWH4_LIBCB|nr:Glutamate 5-kinase [Liberibacter crescens BT-1]